MTSGNLQHHTWTLWKSLYQRLKPYVGTSQKSVFVAGNQRSGTNMLMDCLERSLETDVFHERDERAFDDYQMRELEVIDRLRDQSRAEHFVIKSLCELHELRELVARYSPAKIVWIVRRYDDVVNSMMRSFGGFSRELAMIAADRESAEWRGRGMSDETHGIVREFSSIGVNDESAAALQWYYRNILFFDQGFEKDDRVLVVKYENLVSDPSQQFSRIFGFLGINYTPFISRKVFASSVNKNKQPVIRPEIRAICDSLLERFSTLAE